MSWLVRPVVGTASDTPASLRLKAAEFLRLASDSKNTMLVAELHRLAASYMDQAQRLERAGSRAGAASPEAKAG